jgi:hypothetical protein
VQKALCGRHEELHIHANLQVSAPRKDDSTKDDLMMDKHEFQKNELDSREFTNFKSE